MTETASIRFRKWDDRDSEKVELPNYKGNTIEMLTFLNSLYLRSSNIVFISMLVTIRFQVFLSNANNAQL